MSTKNKPNPTLVILDMQPDFSASYKALDQVCELINHAIEEEWSIVLLEVQGNGETHSEILYLLEGYDNFRRSCDKQTHSGYQRALELCQEAGFSTDHWVVCGVNTELCVRETVCEFADNLDTSRLDVIKSACATDLAGFRWRDFYQGEPAYDNVYFFADVYEMVERS